MAPFEPFLQRGESRARSLRRLKRKAHSATACLSCSIRFSRSSRPSDMWPPASLFIHLSIRCCSLRMYVSRNPSLLRHGRLPHLSPHPRRSVDVFGGLPWNSGGRFLFKASRDLRSLSHRRKVTPRLPVPNRSTAGPAAGPAAAPTPATASGRRTATSAAAAAAAGVSAPTKCVSARAESDRDCLHGFGTVITGRGRRCSSGAAAAGGGVWTSATAAALLSLAVAAAAAGEEHGSISAAAAEAAGADAGAAVEAEGAELPGLGRRVDVGGAATADGHGDDVFGFHGGRGSGVTECAAEDGDESTRDEG